jgi:hypothetical protein
MGAQSRALGRDHIGRRRRHTGEGGACSARGDAQRRGRQRTSKTFPQGAEHWSAAPGVQSTGHLPPAQPERQAGAVLTARSLPNTELMLHGLVRIVLGGIPTWARQTGGAWVKRSPSPMNSCRICMIGVGGGGVLLLGLHVLLLGPHHQQPCRRPRPSLARLLSSSPLHLSRSFIDFHSLLSC